MKVKPKELQQRINHFQQVLRRAGLKLTHQRLQIFREIAKSGDHPDAETIYQGVCRRVPTVSPDTVYRTLWLLLDLGLINTFGFSRERIRFDPNTDSHHHYICTQCGRIRDFSSEALDQLKIPKTVEALGSVERAQVEVRGLCLRCCKKEI